MKARFMVFAAAAALVSAPALLAQEEDVAEQPAASGEGQSASSQKQQQGKPFHMLPLCRLMEGGAEVLRPGAQEWEPLEEGKFYPLGCAYRTVSETSRLTIQFGSKSEVRIDGVASFGTRVQEVGLKDRTVILRGGTITVSLPRNMQAGLFKVSAPGFVVTDLSGESSYRYEGTGDGDVATVRCVTGTFAVEGRHFRIPAKDPSDEAKRIPAIDAADELKIRTSQDLLFTGLYGVNGDCIVKLDQGLTLVHDVETDEDKRESRVLDWHLSPRTAVRIHRAVPKIGERMSVTVMTFDETGALVNRCAFAEGMAELNTGEQGAKALAALTAKAKDKDVKNALADADAVTTESAPEDVTTETESTEANTTTTEESTED